MKHTFILMQPAAACSSLHSSYWLSILTLEERSPWQEQFREWSDLIGLFAAAITAADSLIVRLCGRSISWEDPSCEAQCMLGADMFPYVDRDRWHGQETTVRLLDDASSTLAELTWHHVTSRDITWHHVTRSVEQPTVLKFSLCSCLCRYRKQQTVVSVKKHFILFCSLCQFVVFKVDIIYVTQTLAGLKESDSCHVWIIYINNKSTCEYLVIMRMFFLFLNKLSRCSVVVFQEALSDSDRIRWGRFLHLIINQSVFIYSPQIIDGWFTTTPSQNRKQRKDSVESFYDEEIDKEI